MRRMLLPEVKIKSKIKDDIYEITFEELLTHGWIDPNRPDNKNVIIQVLSQRAGDTSAGEGIYISDSNDLNVDITNATLTTTHYEDDDEIYINGLGINVLIDLSVTNIEDLKITSSTDFDVYIIKQ